MYAILKKKKKHSKSMIQKTNLPKTQTVEIFILNP